MAVTHAPGFLKLVESIRPGIHEVSVADALAAMARDPRARLIDVREDGEWEVGHATSATHLSRGIIERDIEGVVPDPSTPLYLYCGGGFRSALAADSLQRMGYTNVHSIAGGWRAWVAADAPMQVPGNYAT
jgi:rhodanese-related sulfurtransferase